jgi:Fic family protein
MTQKFALLPVDKLPFSEYLRALDLDIESKLQTLSLQKFSIQDFKFYTSVSVITSSKIEGETLEVDSYVKHKIQDVEYLPNLTQKPDDLFEAYVFAQNNPLTVENFLHAHKLLTQHLLPEKDRGQCRKNEMLVMEHDTGRIQYEAAPAVIVEKELNKFWNDIGVLIVDELTPSQVFYAAALLHLVFVNIHPFNDGNGRAARLLEKWFLAEKLGKKAWYIQSEKYYYKNIDQYYKNLAVQGMFYEQLNYSKAHTFLVMLPKSLSLTK